MKVSSFRFSVFSFSRFLVFTLAAALFITQASAQVVEIPDPNLKTAIREALELPDDVPITQQEMETLAELSAWNSGITDLTGLEHATFLQVASFVRNQIRDITPLAGLIHLRILALEGNPVSDITPLANLTNLENLRISGDPPIRDITPLANLTRLKTLKLANQAISDIFVLAKMTILTYLNVEGNQIVDISPLIGLENLEELYLAGNPVKDFTPLVALGDIELDIAVDISQLDPLNLVVTVPDTNLETAIREALSLQTTESLTRRQMLRLLKLDAQNNRITDLTGLEYATELTELHLCDNQIHDLRPLERLVHLGTLTLCANLLKDISPLASLTQLRILDLKDNMIQDIMPLANLTLLEELGLERNGITDIRPLIELTNLKKLRLADNPIRTFSVLLELEDVELDVEVDSSKFDPLNGIIEIPDPNLEKAIWEALELPDDRPITTQEMEQLTELSAWNSGITDLTGLEHATFLKLLALRGNQIQDLTPIAGLIHLELLTLDRNPIFDISPLENLVNLEILRIPRTSVSDISPLANLIKLETLWINQTLVTDFTPVQRLNLIEFVYDQACEIPLQSPSVRERIENRTFPSIFQPWNDVVGLDHLTWEQRNVLHDLHWHPRFDHQIQWNLTLDEPTRGLATSLTGDIARAHEVRQRRLSQNPNMIFLGGFSNTSHAIEFFPQGSDLWLRDDNGKILRKHTGVPLIDFVKPEVQDLLVKRAIAFAHCGLYDGIMLDEFGYHGHGFSGRHLYPYSDEEIIQAYTNVFQAIRSQVREDFLIIINANHTKPTRYAEFINGTFMETAKDYPGGYSRPWLMTLEDTLSWNEQHLREPRINCLEGEGMSIEPPDGPNNKRWMRLFTTLSLTHSDGYVIYTTGFRDFGPPYPDHDHLWHSFWDADLGRPVGAKVQRYHNINGLFIREFTNGWAVYNRSRKTQEISLPTLATPVSDRGNNAAALTHQLPDLDGEIYLKARNPADVNGDEKVNILDLLQVANSLGTSAPDPNGDGAVNILDLVYVAQQFNQ